MSRTDVHVPGWVKERDPAWWRTHYTEQHRHVRQIWDPETQRWGAQRAVDCDLGRFLAGERDTNCSMRLAGPSNNISCGCRQCTGQDERKLGRRRERAIWRAAARMILKTDHAELDAIDVPAPTRRCPW
jgi:hypothetical protein